MSDTASKSTELQAKARELYDSLAPDVSSYIAGILACIGADQDDGRYAVRCTDRFYVDMVQPFIGTNVYSVDSHGKTQYVLKGLKSKLYSPSLDEIKSPVDFIRAFAEIQGAVAPITQHVSSGKRHVVGFKLYGTKEILQYIMDLAPIAPKKINHIYTQTGSTWQIILQKRETETFLNYIDGTPCNRSVWDQWNQRIQRILSMDKNP